MLNIFSGHLMAIMNNASVWWHVVGAAAIVLILIFVPTTTSRSATCSPSGSTTPGYGGGSTSGFGFFFAIIPFGFLLTQYTITGFDASAHLSEETGVGGQGGGQGDLAVDLLLGDRRLHPAALRGVRDPERRRRPARQRRWPAVACAPIFNAALGSNWAARSCCSSPRSAQFFCTISCMTSASRMTYAFSRDGAIPGSKRWSALTANRVPANAVMLVAVCAAILTLPALIKVDVTARRCHWRSTPSPRSR